MSQTRNMKTTLFLLIFLVSCVSAFGQDNIQNTDTNKITRYGISLFPTKATKVNGFCLALSHNKPRTINGLNIEFPGARLTEYFFYRLSRRIEPKRFSTINGVTITFNPIYNKVNGLGIFIFNPEINEFNGLAIGASNGAKEMNGVQIGVFNYAIDGRFIQLGLLNTIQSNPKLLRTVPFFNCRLRKKAETKKG